MAACPVLSSLALPKNVAYLADDFVMRSAETVLGSQSWSQEKLYLYVETESDAKYVLDRLRSGEISTSGVIRIITEGLDEPQNVSCHSYGNNKITAEWNYVAGASAYQVYRKIDGDYQLIATVEENSFTEDYVVNNYLYLYKIKAVGSIYGQTEVVSATMGWDAIGSRISDVRNIHAVPLRRNAVTLSWNSKDSYVYKPAVNTQHIPQPCLCALLQLPFKRLQNIKAFLTKCNGMFQRMHPVMWYTGVRQKTEPIKESL